MRNVIGGTLLAGLALLLAAAGCGSDSTSSTSGAGGDGGEPTTSSGGSGGTTTGSGGAGTGTGTGTGSGTGGDGTGGSGGGNDCGSIGSPCDANCPDGLTCYMGSFCIPAASECGGFAGAMCPSGQVCMTLSGADFGPCGTQMVKDCVCMFSPNVLDDCP